MLPLHIVRIQHACKTASAALPVSMRYLPLLHGHFPKEPILPGVIMLQALFSLARTLDDKKVSLLRNARFRKLIRPQHHFVWLKVHRQNESLFRGIVYIRSPDSQVFEIAAEALFEKSL